MQTHLHGEFVDPLPRPHRVGVTVHEAGQETLASHVNHDLKVGAVEAAGGELGVEADVKDEAVPAESEREREGAEKVLIFHESPRVFCAEVAGFDTFLAWQFSLPSARRAPSQSWKMQKKGESSFYQESEIVSKSSPRFSEFRRGLIHFLGIVLLNGRSSVVPPFRG